MRVITFSPVTTGLALLPTLDLADARVHQELASLRGAHPGLRVPTHERRKTQSHYEDLATDDTDLRLCVWEPPPADEGDRIRVHVFPGDCAIVEFAFIPRSQTDAAAIEHEAIERTRSSVDAIRDELDALLAKVRAALPSAWIDGTVTQTATHVLWSARALVLTPQEVPERGDLIETWLENTARPKDAAALIAGDIDYSMTWINYVIATDRAERFDMLCSAMRIAQFFYARQDAINARAREALARAFATTDVREARELFVKARTDLQLLEIQYNELSLVINRQKRRVIDDIMRVWDYDKLVRNGEQMVASCNSRIEEITTKRAEGSTFVTDLILTVIGFLTVIDVLLVVTQYSREVMSRPVLEYQDSDMSWILSAVAAIDTDSVLVGGVISVLILLLLYVYWKLRK
ncbi:MAG: hypothetical protein AAF610_07995 [Pseudomonadota bacterium]